jgi:hypothetical protein
VKKPILRGMLDLGVAVLMVVVFYQPSVQAIDKMPGEPVGVKMVICGSHMAVTWLVKAHITSSTKKYNEQDKHC